MSIDECRIKEFFLFYLLKIAERSDIHNSSFAIHHSSFPEVSYECPGLKNTKQIISMRFHFHWQPFIGDHYLSMIHFRILLSFGFIILFGASAEALFIHQGIHGMKWGGSISDFDPLTKVHQKKQAAFYYSPLADSLNQEQLEQIPAKAYGPDPSKAADSVKSVPLLDY